MKDKIEQIALLLTVILSILVSLADFFGLIDSFPWLSVRIPTISLLLLGIVAGYLILERRSKLDKIDKTANQLVEHMTALESKMELRISLDSLFRSRSELPPFTLWLRQNDEIWIAGISLYSVVNTFGRQIELAAQNGKHFRLMICNPDNPSIWNVLASGSFTYSSSAEMEQLARDTLARLERIVNNSPKDAIEIRLTDYGLTASYLIIDGGKPRGQMIVEQYAYKISAGERVHLFLKRDKDSNNFDFHLRQFESMWQDAKQWPD